MGVNGSSVFIIDIYSNKPLHRKAQTVSVEIKVPRFCPTQFIEQTLYKSATRDKNYPFRILETATRDKNYPFRILETATRDKKYPFRILESTTRDKKYPFRILETATRDKKYPFRILETATRDKKYPFRILETATRDKKYPFRILETAIRDKKYPFRILETATRDKNYPFRILESTIHYKSNHCIHISIFASALVLSLSKEVNTKMQKSMSPPKQNHPSANKKNTIANFEVFLSDITCFLPREPLSG